MNFTTLLYIMCAVPMIVCQTVPKTISEIDSKTTFQYINETVTEFIPETLPKTFAGPITTITLKLDEYTSLQSSYYPEQPYPEGDWGWIIKSGKDDFGIEVIIKALDLNGENGDYVLLQPGNENDKQEPAKLFTWKIREEKKYRLHHLDHLYINFVANKPAEPNTHKGFEIWLKSIGEIPTTTEPPTTEDPSILQPRSESYIYLKGMNVTTFHNESREALRDELIWMAEAYCEEEKIIVETNISTNVNFHIISTCPLDWDDYENCILIRYSIPVNSDTNLTHGYELTSKHLDDMWAKYNGKLSIPGLNPFFPPNYHSMMMGWIWISIGVFVIFVIFLYLLQRYNCFNDYISSILIQEDVERKKSNASLFPTPHQILPPLIDSDSYPHDEKTWMSELPPEYSEKPQDGEINLGFDDEIIMSLEDSMDQKSQIIRRSVDTVEAYESNL